MPKLHSAICLGFVGFVLFGLATAVNAQPFTSPPASSSITISDKKVTVDYYAPSMRGRKIMGGLVPFGEVWCPGANWGTKLTMQSDLELHSAGGSLKLPKGEYTIWAIPNEKEWTLIVNSETGQFHLDYKADRDFGRMKMDLAHLEAPVETFKIALTEIGPGKGKLAIIWETTEASVSFDIVP